VRSLWSDSFRPLRLVRVIRRVERRLTAVPRDILGVSLEALEGPAFQVMSNGSGLNLIRYQVAIYGGPLFPRAPVPPEKYGKCFRKDPIARGQPQSRQGLSHRQIATLVQKNRGDTAQYQVLIGLQTRQKQEVLTIARRGPAMAGRGPILVDATTPKASIDTFDPHLKEGS
jgi:hypothetical protein